MLFSKQQLHFNTMSSASGNLVALESLKNIPFEIQRVYYIWNTSEEARGFHSHRENKQVLICLQGSLDLYFEDIAGKKTQFHLKSPSEGIFIDTWIWHEMHNFSKDCIVIVLASHLYDESDYIRNYNQFKSEATGQNK
jgi:dTDP-4-dehydrorhamnose 3,5-epimerase-like enzyme